MKGGRRNPCEAIEAMRAGIGHTPARPWCESVSEHGSAEDVAAWQRGLYMLRPQRSSSVANQQIQVAMESVIAAIRSRRG